MITHLSIRTTYTLLESTIQVEDLVKRAKELGYDSIAITDRHVLYAYPSLMKYAKQYGIKPIFGLEVLVEYHEDKVPFLLLAKDNLGYQNLMHLSSLLSSFDHLDGEEYCTIEEFKQYSEHNFIIVYGEGGYFEGDLIKDNREGVIKKLSLMKEELPSFDVAISYEEASLWKIKNKALKQVCRQLSISTVALNKVYYLNKKDEDTFHVLSAIKNKKTIYDASLTKITGRYLLSIPEMKNLYDEEDLERTSIIAKECHANLEIDKTSLPTFAVPNHLRSDQYLTQLCLAGLKKRKNNQVPQEYIQRLKYELDVIIKMHFENYFLIVYDFIRYAKKNDILIGPGRGSVCGSLCAYCLGITEIDPLKYDLLFERFLNPERISMPDIDTDIPDNKRQDLIQYVQQKYGIDHVGEIVTFGTFGPRQALRDVSKALNLSERDISLVVKQVSSKVGLQEQLNTNKKLRDIVNADIKLKRLYEKAIGIEGLARHTSIHAAGVLLSKLKINDIVPTTKNSTVYVSQYTMEYLEERGLIKMDFLGLKNLTMIQEMVKEIQKINPSFELPYEPIQDNKIYETLSRGYCLGIFQVESLGMRNVLRKMKVNCFDDLVAAIALYRPASFDQIDVYVKQKNNPSSIQYINEDVKKILSSTYGVMIYQEQAMKISEVCAGFTLGKADILRKAISKKNIKQLQNLKEDFIEGCLKNHYSSSDATRLYELIEKFGGYGFNKSHAVAYSLIVYQMTYIKTYYPTIFYATYLNNCFGNTAKISECIKEASTYQIKVVGPDVNQSINKCVIEDRTIRFPFSSIQGISSMLVNAIIQEREKGKYEDFYDFIARTSLLGLSRSEAENLIYAGTFDSFHENRETLIHALDDAFNYSELVKIHVNGEVKLNYNLVSKQQITKYADNLDEKIKKERDVLGVYLGEHPIIQLRQKINSNLMNLALLQKQKYKVEGVALISSIREHRTKKGDLMAFVTVSDESAEMTILVMPKLFEQIHSKLLKNTYIIFKGKITEDLSCIAEEIQVVRL